MAKRIYQVGEPCDVCGTATVVGKGGTGYCKPCYISWKNSTEALKAPVRGYNPASVQTPTQPPIAVPSVPQSVTDALQKISESLKEIKADIRYLREEAIKRETGKDYVPQVEEAKINDEITIDAIPF